MKALEIKTPMVFNFANNNILSYFFFVSLIIELYFLNVAVIAQIFNLTAEIVSLWENQLKKQNEKLKYIQ